MGSRYVADRPPQYTPEGLSARTVGTWDWMVRHLGRNPRDAPNPYDSSPQADVRSVS
jgi:hypothetical protein